MVKTKIKLSIYSIALLMMGAIGISGGLAVIGANFAGESQTMIQSLISIPCIVIIPTTLIVGKLMQSISKKSMVLFGSLCFLIGGVAPAFMNELVPIIMMRAILGVGVGISQVVSTALVAENFKGAEQEKVQGMLQACQMGGLAVMVFAGGALADIGWNLTFYIHIIAVITFAFCLVMLKGKKPEAAVEQSKNKPKVRLKKETWMWVAVIFVLFLSVQVYSISLSFLVEEFQWGTATDSGLSLAFFAIGGVVMGALYGKLAKIMRNCAIAVGCALLVIAYLMMAFAGGMMLCYVGSVIFGMALSAAMPGIFVNSSISVDAYSAGMAISLVTCSQNFAQFICPYILNPVSSKIAMGGSANFTVFILAAIIAAALLVFMLIWGLRRNRKESRPGRRA